MTSVTMATCERNMDTAVRPRGSLEELVDRLMKTLFSADSETAASTPTTTQASVIHDARRHEHVEGGDTPGTLGVFGVETTGEAAVRRPGRTDLDREHRQGRSTRSPPRCRHAGGRCGAGDALEAGQDRLAAQPSGAWALDKGLHLIYSTSVRGVGVACNPVAIIAPRARCPWPTGCTA